MSTALYGAVVQNEGGRSGRRTIQTASFEDENTVVKHIGPTHKGVVAINDIGGVGIKCGSCCNGVGCELIAESNCTHSISKVFAFTRVDDIQKSAVNNATRLSLSMLDTFLGFLISLQKYVF